MSASSMRAGLLVTVGWAALGVSDPATAGTFTTDYRYNSDRQVTGVILPDPDGTGPINFGATRNSYDAEGRLTSVEQGELSAFQAATIAPANWAGFTVFRTITYTYDSDGRRTKETLTDSGGTVKTLTQTNYDAIDRPVCLAVRMDPAQWNGQSDACAPQTNGPDGADRITKTLYDNDGHVSKIQKAFGTALQQDYATYTYGADNQVTSVTDANLNRTEYSYDTLDRLQRWYFPSKTSAQSASTTDFEEYAYDLNGNRLTLKKRDNRIIKYTYDALNRVTSKCVTSTGACVTPTAATGRDVFYAYDNRGLQLTALFDSSSGAGITNTYDNVGRLASSTDSLVAAQALSYTYDADGNRLTVTHPGTGAPIFTYAYDGLDRLQGISQSATSLLTITYDNQGRRSALNRLTGVNTAYGYDTASRLSSLADAEVGTAQDLTTTLTYNPASQIKTRVRSNDAFIIPQGSGTRTYTVNGLNQYSGVNGAAYTYDANGNLTGDGSTTYSYDAENRMTGASGVVNASLSYDPLGRLYQTSGASGANLTKYLYDGDELVLEYNSAGTVTNRYVHGTGADDPLIWFVGSGTASTARRYLFADSEGSIVSITDASGNPAGINSYDDWGGPPLAPNPANTGRFQYTGQAWLPELGMYYYKARIYAPLLGRFMQTDPIGYADQQNLYAYVGNDPVNATDTSGKRLQIVGSTDYQELVYRDLKKIAAGPHGNEMLRTIIKSNFLIQIKEPESDRSGNYTRATDLEGASGKRGSGSTVFYDPLNNLGGVDDKGHDIRPPYVGLGHELGHAEDFMGGRVDLDYPDDKKPGTTPVVEDNSMKRESEIRSEHRLTPRSDYYPKACVNQHNGCPK